MSETVIQIEGLSKSYRLGEISGKRFVDDAGRAWAKIRGKPNPLERIGHSTSAKNRDSDGSYADEIWAIKNVSLEVSRGEVLGIIGRNGAGKSTLLKILSRVTAPTRGEVRIKGRVASLLEVGTGFHPELTGRENVFLNGAILGMTKDEIRKQFDEIVEFSGFEKFIDTPVKRYSSGMWVRLAFAVAAHLEPEILIIDEVLAVGDAAFQEKCLGKMESVANEGRTVILVSHNMSTIQQICKRCVLLRKGEVHLAGETSKVVGDYFSDSKPASSLELRDWHDRSGSGDARLTRLTAIDESGNQTADFALGSTVSFQIEAECYRELVDPCFGVIIHNSAGEAILDVKSEHDGLRVGPVNGSFQIQVQIPNIGLYPGKYFVSPWITAARRDVDFARFSGNIRILPSPGKFGDLRLDPKWGKYFVASEWSRKEQ